MRHGNLVFSLTLAVLAALAGPANARDPANPVLQQRTGGDGRPYLALLPTEMPSAVVYVFHGRGGDERFAVRRATRTIVDALAERGYAIISTQSTNRGNGRSDRPADKAGWDYDSHGDGPNADFDRMYQLHRSLVDAGTLQVTTPIFTMGMSNGGGMANAFAFAACARAMPVAGVANYLGPLPAVADNVTADRHKPPLFTVLAENDGVVRLYNQLSAIERFRGNGGTVELHIAREGPVTIG